LSVTKIVLRESDVKRDSVEHELSNYILFVCDYCEIITAVVVIVVGVTRQYSECALLRNY